MSTPPLSPDGLSAPRHRADRGSSRPRRHARLAALLSVLLLLTGCASAVQEAKQAADGPREGGTLRVGTVDDISPTTIFNSSELVPGQIYDSLVDYPLDSIEPQPVLATDWTFSDGGRSLTLQLRDDVTFHSGREFTSKDVEFSIKTWADPVWAVQLQRTAAAVAGFDTSKPHEITLHFAHRLSNIFDLLDMMPIIDSETIDQLKEGTAFVGTGPFVFDSWEPGVQYTLTRNEDYWAEPAYLDAVEVKIVPDAQAQVSQLRAGQLDVIVSGSNRDLETLGKDERYRVEKWVGSETSVYMGANVKNPALSDVRVRQAVAFALDRDRIVEEVYRGAGVPNDLPWPPSSPAYDEEAAHRFDYDLDKAKALVQEYEDEHGEVPELPLTYMAEDGNMAQVAQIAQQDLEKIGIQVKLDPQEQGTVLKQLIGGKFEGLWLLVHYYAQFTPSLTVSAFPFNGEHNASNYVDPGYRKAADAAWKLPPDQAVTPGAYDALNRELLDGLFLMEIATLYPQTATTAAVGGISRTKRQELLFGRAYLGK